MNKDISELRTRWQLLNELYDGYIQEFLFNSRKYNSEEIIKMQEMQQELFAIEEQIFFL